MKPFSPEKNILFEDPHILVIRKEAGMAVQSAAFGSMDLESALKNYLAQKVPGKMPYLGLIHRLDQPVEGAIVFAKTPAAAKELSRQMSGGDFGKIYLAVTDQLPPSEQGNLIDYLLKDGRKNMSQVVKKGTAAAKEARLAYTLLDSCEDSRTSTGQKHLVRIKLDTGRHHQIRVQMSHAGMPLLGDRKYNPEDKSGYSLALCSCHLEFRHPVNKKVMKFDVQPQGEAFQNLKNPI